MSDLARIPGRAPATVLVRRRSAATRITHWIDALHLGVLLTIGLQIFNAHPELSRGRTGQTGDVPALAIAAVERDGRPRGELRVGGAAIPTPGVLGVSGVDGAPVARAFPAQATLPSATDLAAGRRWRFFFAWPFVANGAVYLLVGFAGRHLQRDLAPGERRAGNSRRRR